MTPEYEPCIYHSVEVPVYFEIHVRVTTTAHEDVQPRSQGSLPPAPWGGWERTLGARLENVSSGGKGLVGANLCIHF